jgi:hypothetical protein
LNCAGFSFMSAANRRESGKGFDLKGAYDG